MKRFAITLMMAACGHTGWAASEISLITLDPGHFHAALIQKSMYPQVSPKVHVYSPGGPDLELHLQRIAGFNSRQEQPTQWKEIVYSGPDYLKKMLQEKAGNLVVISGNNSLKGKYILGCVQAGLNVLSDKPMAITPADFELLKQAFSTASKNGAFIYDIMPERSEIASVLQRELAQNKRVFGQFERGTPDEPAVVQENVHYFVKDVAGKPLVRPPWFFDVKQQGEGIVDVNTHLVDLVQCGLFLGQVLAPEDAHVLSAHCSNTALTREQFKRVTQTNDLPDYLQSSLDASGALQVRSNGTFVYTLRGIHVRISTEWRFQAPAGMGDTHFSLMRGTHADLFIRQEAEEKFIPTLYILKRSNASDSEFESELRKAIAQLAKAWPGIGIDRAQKGWKLVIPDMYRLNHEARFAKVATTFFGYLKERKVPAWETAGMLTKYSTLMQAYALSRPSN